MSFKATLTPAFVRELKGLSKKYASLKKDLSDLLTSLTENPKQGIPLGNNCYKIRMSISSKHRGKSGGARIITFVKIVDEVVYLVSIYDKSEVETISDADLLSRVKNL